MSRRGNCHEIKLVRASGVHDPGDHLQAQNAVAESFFQVLKREKIRRRTYRTREAARRDVLEYIGLFYDPKRKRTNVALAHVAEVFVRHRRKEMRPVRRHAINHGHTEVVQGPTVDARENF